ncbi:Heat shock factor protein 5 [Lonchura striata]|uniref:Heat shock factor protein 5 n=1 Tax=Lonchura striata TaxID=40157 RepID=A0A218VAI1_9PASE|nr:Heat shock factor protein 5 [Lonchura striata domestica]
MREAPAVFLRPPQVPAVASKLGRGRWVRVSYDEHVLLFPEGSGLGEFGSDKAEQRSEEIPGVHSVRWDARGEGLFIDQGLFEQELLGVGPGAAGEEELFKTRNFGSIVRQLNLYGFHKLMVSPAGSAPGARPRPATAEGDTRYADGPLHHFWNPHFRYGRPDLLVKIKRRTKANKEKLDAGLEVTSRLPDDLQYITRR